MAYGIPEISINQSPDDHISVYWCGDNTQYCHFEIFDHSWNLVYKSLSYFGVCRTDSVSKTLLSACGTFYAYVRNDAGISVGDAYTSFSQAVDISVTYESVSNVNPVVGDTINITVGVGNGGCTGSESINISVDGNVKLTKDMTVPSGTKTSTVFPYIIPKDMNPGTHRICAFGSSTKLISACVDITVSAKPCAPDQGNQYCSGNSLCVWDSSICNYKCTACPVSCQNNQCTAPAGQKYVCDTSNCCVPTSACSGTNCYTDDPACGGTCSACATNGTKGGCDPACTKGEHCILGKCLANQDLMIGAAVLIVFMMMSQ